MIGIIFPPISVSSLCQRHLPYFQQIVDSLHISATLALCFQRFVDSFAKNTGGWGIGATRHLKISSHRGLIHDRP
jgi:hypothetical protein